MKKQATYYHDMTEEQEKEMERIEAELPAWQETKIVTETTPLIYLTQTISAHLAEKEQGKQNLIYAVKLFQTDEAKFKELLIEAGCTIEALPSND